LLQIRVAFQKQEFPAMNWTCVPDVAAWQFRYTFHWSWSGRQC